MTVKPAYGRDYTTAEAARQAWNEGKDFILAQTGQYINKADFVKYGPRGLVTIRYAKLTKCVIVPYNG